VNVHRWLSVVVLGQVLALSSVASPPSLLAQAPVDLRGRVVDDQTSEGVANLEVKLTPPARSRLPVRFATTDRNGRFTFARLARSRYLIEVSQGIHLLYRAEIDTNRQDTVEIRLRRRR
jgi:hypothetical protein